MVGRVMDSVTLGLDKDIGYNGWETRCLVGEGPQDGVGDERSLIACIGNIAGCFRQSKLPSITAAGEPNVQSVHVLNSVLRQRRSESEVSTAKATPLAHSCSIWLSSCSSLHSSNRMLRRRAGFGGPLADQFGRSLCSNHGRKRGFSFFHSATMVVQVSRRQDWHSLGTSQHIPFWRWPAREDSCKVATL